MTVGHFSRRLTVEGLDEVEEMAFKFLRIGLFVVLLEGLAVFFGSIGLQLELVLNYDGVLLAHVCVNLGQGHAAGLALP